MTVRRAAVVLAVLAGAACTDQGPVSAPGVLTAALSSPNGPEGAAVISLAGAGIGATVALGDAVLFRSDTTGVTTLVLISPTGGDLAFQVELADSTRRPIAAVAQVAGPDDELRPSLAGYRVEWSR